MTWTKETTEELGELSVSDPTCFACTEERQYGSTGAAHRGLCELPSRAVAHIGALEARVAELEKRAVSVAESLRGEFDRCCPGDDSCPWNHALLLSADDAEELAAVLEGEGAPAPSKLLTRLATLESERTEVARELRKVASRVSESDDPYAAILVGDLAIRLERKGE